MTFAYVDSSIFIAILFEERGFKKCIDRLQSFDELLTTSLTFAEVCSAVKREQGDLNQALKLLSMITLFHADSSMTDELQEVLNLGYLRGADLYHVASAIKIDPTKKELHFISLDKSQKKAASACGFLVE